MAAYSLRGGSVSQDPLPEQVSEFQKVVVYLEGIHLAAAEPVSARLDQKDAHFTPDLLVVPVGSTVSFPNLDPIFHNVFSLSKARQFDLGYYPAGQTRTVRFDKAGVVHVFCHLHSNMSAAVVVVPNKYFAMPGPQGEFAIPDVPAGEYHLVAWHKANGFARQVVVVAEHGETAVTLRIPIKEETEPPRRQQ